MTAKVQRGDVRVLGESPLSRHSLIPGPGIGYMPQELALHNYINVKETLWFFGKLNLLKTSILEKEIEKLRSVLNLPPDHVCVDNLSGGQKRRMSLAIALLHNPPLLILDEPIVGLDPLLRKKIWTHLVHLSNTQNTTIVVTTHYIEEARDANIISAMRNGRILQEASPEVFMLTHGSNNLEECFLKLCSQDNSQMIDDKSFTNTLKGTISNGNVEEVLKKARLKTNPMHRMMILCRRNLILFKKNKPELIYQFLVPLVTLILYYFCVGSQLRDVGISIVNDEGHIGQNRLGETFVKHMDKSYVTVTQANFTDALNSVQNGDSWAFLYIGENFTDCFKRKLEERLDVDEDTVKCGTIYGYFDLSNQQIYYTLFRSFAKSYQWFMEEFLDSINKTRMIARFPLDMSSTISGSHDANFGTTMISGIVLAMSTFLAAGLCVFKILNERNTGVFERIEMCAVTKTETLISSYATEMLKALIVALSMLICMFGVFQLPQEGSYILLFLIVTFQGLEGISFGLLVSSIFDNAPGAIVIVVGAMTFNIIACGVLWPLEAMPTNFKNVTYFLPLTMPNEAFKAIMLQGKDLESLVVWLGFASTFSWIFVNMGLTLLIMKYFK